MALTIDTVKTLNEVLTESREIVTATYEVSQLLLDARRYCTFYNFRAAEAALVEATAKHQMLTNRTVRMLRKADAAVAELSGILQTGPTRSD